MNEQEYKEAFGLSPEDKLKAGKALEHALAATKSLAFSLFFYRLSFCPVLAVCRPMKIPTLRAVSPRTGENLRSIV